MTKNRLLIVGAGGFGREVLGWALAVPSDARDWEVGGFLDANQAALDGFPGDYSILGDPSSYVPGPNDVFLPAVADPATKLRICRRLRSRGGRFATLIHPSVICGPACRIGEGCVLCPHVTLTTNVTLGEFVTINAYSGCGHDSVLGDGCTISSHADVTGAVRLGEGVFLGSHAAVLPRVEVGNFAVIGAGSAVVRDVPARATVIGVPAKQIAGFDAGPPVSTA
jgi:sugar O-acyltransferase (sialic acid O-acetyltransferase NeuD family)